MNSFNPLRGGSNGVGDDMYSRDQLVNDMFGNAYHIVRDVYHKSGMLEGLYEFLLQYGLTTNVAVKSPVEAVITGNINLYGNQQINWESFSGSHSVLGTTGMRVLVLGQDDHKLNGIYNIQSREWTRAVDFTGPMAALDGTLVFSSQGDAWQVKSPTFKVEIGVTPIEFKEIDFFAHESVKIATQKAQEAANSAAASLASEQAAKASEVSSNNSEQLAAQHAVNAEASKVAAKDSETKSKASEVASKASEDAAKNAASLAESVSQNDRTFASTSLGIAGTTNGQYFRVPQGTGSTLSFAYFRNDNGTATPVAELPGKGSITNNIREYASLTTAQTDVTAGNIPLNAYCYVRDVANGNISAEYVNTAGTLVATGNVVPSKKYVDDSTLTAKLIEVKSSTSMFHRWKDKLGTVLVGWKSDDAGRIYFLSRLLKFGTDGFFGEGMTLSANKLSTNQVTMQKGTDGKTRILDKRGVLLALIENGKMTLSQVTLNLLTKLSVTAGNTGVTISRDKGGIAIKDSRGVTGFRLNNDGTLQGNFPKAEAIPYVMPETQIIQNMEASAAALQSNRFNTLYNTGKGNKKVKVILVYGQSFSAGAQSNSVLSTDPVNKYGNVMLGNSPRGTYFSNPPVGSEVYGAVGGNVFRPLREVLQANDGTIVATSTGYGETICTTLGNEFKRLHNEALGVDNDESFVVCVGSCGVSGRAISQLQKGATPELYNRVETFLDGVKEACNAEGSEFEVVAIVYMQGENDNSQSYSYYLNQSLTMRSNLIASCKAKSGQTYDPIYVVNQLGNTYVTGMGVPSAQLAMAETAPNTLMVGTYAGLPNPGAHLCANSYRQMGAIFAKEIYRYYSNNGDFPFKAHKAYHRGDSIYISYTPHVVPLRFRASYNKWESMMMDDKGYTVTDDEGTLLPTDFTVSIVSNRVIKIKAKRELVGGVTVTLGDRNHFGIHNLADSSNELCGVNWVYSGSTPGQYTQENIAEYKDKPYSLHTYAAIQQINSEVI